MLSLIIPVYRNREALPELIIALEELHRALAGELEAVLVVDGSPDDSFAYLHQHLPTAAFPSRLVLLSRNFGAFAAVRAGLEAGTGDLFAVIAADGQEPAELVVTFRDRLREGTCDVVLGRRSGRADPLLTRWTSALFWRLYRRLVQPSMPTSGIDVFAFTRVVRDRLLALDEHNSSLVGLLLWLGFRRAEVEYERRPRRHGRSAWTFARKLRYLLDSTFAFSDLPIRLLSLAGVLGVLTSVGLGSAVVVARTTGAIAVPGYAATVIVVMFFGGLNSLGIGLIGEYLWRTFENTKGRPQYVVAASEAFTGRDGTA